jgi:hypothetical protein
MLTALIYHLQPASAGGFGVLAVLLAMRPWRHRSGRGRIAIWLFVGRPLGFGIFMLAWGFLLSGGQCCAPC